MKRQLLRFNSFLSEETMKGWHFSSFCRYLFSFICIHSHSSFLSHLFQMRASTSSQKPWAFFGAFNLIAWNFGNCKRKRSNKKSWIESAAHKKKPEIQRFLRPLHCLQKSDKKRTIERKRTKEQKRTNESAYEKRHRYRQKNRKRTNEGRRKL